MKKQERYYLPLLVILTCYLVIGVLFATKIPAWQVPDEPAHYNYIRQLAAGIYPTLEPNDWDPTHQTISPRDRPADISRMSYEDHQPPAYYATALPIWWVFRDNLTALRIWSLSLSCIIVICAYQSALIVFNNHISIASISASFAAFLPQHIHMMAGFNNDSLSESLLALTILQSIILVRDGISARRKLAYLGLTIGLALITKAQAYLCVPIAILALVIAARRHSVNFHRDLFSSLAIVLTIACIIGLPLWAHNLYTYGKYDFLGLQHHNLIVVGQPTPQMWITEFGTTEFLIRLVTTTFNSFWGQFGWMAVTNTKLYYFAIAITLTTIISLTFLRPLEHIEDATLGNRKYYIYLLGCLVLMTVGSFVWYNTQFVQHQGRYLYPALIPLSLVIGTSWNRIFRNAKQGWMIFLTAFVVLDLWALFRVIVPAL